MTRLLRIGGIVVLFFVMCLQLQAQRDSRLGPPISMNLSSAMVSGDYVKIPYEIPYDGYIIFDLYSPEGEKIWEFSTVQLKGNHVQSVKRTPLKAGLQYTFDFWYKGKKYSGKFTNG